MDSEKIFTVAGGDTWLGGFYELAIELGTRSDERLRKALHVIATFPSLESGYTNPKAEYYEQERFPFSDAIPLDEFRGMIGIATLPDSKRLATGIITIREEEGPDWLLVYFPIGALHSSYDEVGSYPFGVGGASTLPKWEMTVIDWLKEIGIALYAEVPYRLGLVGHEVSGKDYADTLISQGGIPEERWIGYLWPTSEGLIWYAPTHFEAPYTMELPWYKPTKRATE